MTLITLHIFRIFFFSRRVSEIVGKNFVTPPLKFEVNAIIRIILR